MYCSCCYYPLDSAAQRCSECGRAFVPTDPSTYSSTPGSTVGRPIACFVAAVAGAVTLGAIGHALTVFVPTLSGAQVGLASLLVLAILVAASSALRRRTTEAAAIAFGVSIGAVGFFVVGGWIVSASVFMPARWVLVAPLVLLAVYVPIALASAALGRSIRRRTRGRPGSVSA